MPAKLFLSANKILEISKNIMGSHKYIYRGILFTPLTLLAQMTLLICSVYNSVFRTVLEWVSHTFQLLFIYRIGNTLLSKKNAAKLSTWWMVVITIQVSMQVSRNDICFQIVKVVATVVDPLPNIMWANTNSFERKCFCGFPCFPFWSKH